MFARLAENGGPAALMIVDATHMKTHRSAGRRKTGAEAQAVERSRPSRRTQAFAGRAPRRRPTEIHAGVDQRGRPFGLIFRPVRRGDAPVAAAPAAGFAREVGLAGPADDGDALRKALIDRGTSPVIPDDPARKSEHPFDRSAHRARNVVEGAFFRFEDRRCIATRWDKLAVDRHAAACIAATVACR